MSYTYTFDIHLGPICAGLTLAAQLIDTAGVSVGSEITSGFVEAGSNGDYLLTASIPDGHRGGVLVYEDGAPGVVLAVGAINPEDAEYVASILQDTGTALPALIAGVGAGSGTGYYSDTVDNGTSPLDGVRVQLYTAADRVGLAYEAYTNALGVFEMWPDPGTYYRWLDLAGYSFTQDVEVEVTEP